MYQIAKLYYYNIILVHKKLYYYFIVYYFFYLNTTDAEYLVLNPEHSLNNHLTFIHLADAFIQSGLQMRNTTSDSL